VEQEEVTLLVEVVEVLAMMEQQGMSILVVLVE